MAHDEAAVLRDCLAALAAPGVRVGVRAIRAADVDALHPEEAQVVARAVPHRRAEYASGRVLLRELLGEPLAIPSRPDRTAAWPAGVRGSLAHDHDYVVAVLSDSPSVWALGVDIEPAARLDPAVAAAVLRPDEAVDPVLAFVAKEAAYKAWHTLGGDILEHHEVHVQVVGGRFVATVRDHTRLAGAVGEAAGRWLACVAVTSPEADA